MSEEPAKLIQAAQRGDLRAFQQLYELHVGRVYALCQRLLVDRQRAEDACQESFIKIWRQLPGFRGDSSFTTWLHSIATRTAIDLWRSDRMLRLVDDTEPDDCPATQQTPQEISAGVDMEQAIRNLPPQARAVFVLFAIEGHTHQEIADLLNIAQGSSKAHYHRARQLLKEWLREH